MLSRHYATLSGLTLLSALIGCSINPYTQRTQLVMIAPTYETTLGAAAYRKFLADHRVRTDDAVTRPVQRVMARLIAAAQRSEYADVARSFDWEIAVLDEPGLRNAIALPGGKIVVYTGLFPVADSEAGLAAVLGHEIVHALARHSAEQLTYDALQMVRAHSERLPFSRRHESEADYIGLLLMAEAGYDPREAVRMWERMKGIGEDAAPEFGSTHPSYETRIRHLGLHMEEAWTRYERTHAAPMAPLPAVEERAAPRGAPRRPTPS